MGYDTKLVRDQIYYKGVIEFNHATNFMSYPNDTQKMNLIS
jgi:hypothetical protein